MYILVDTQNTRAIFIMPRMSLIIQDTPTHLLWSSAYLGYKVHIMETVVKQMYCRRVRTAVEQNDLRGYGMIRHRPSRLTCICRVHTII